MTSNQLTPKQQADLAEEAAYLRSFGVDPPSKKKKQRAKRSLSMTDIPAQAEQRG